LVDPDTYLLPVSRYIESNAVRADLVDASGDYDWSSYAANALGTEDELVSPHPVYRALGTTEAQRQRAYRSGFEQPLSQEMLERIRNATNKAWVLGDDAFCQEIEGQLNRRAKPRPRGGDRRSAAYRQRRGQAAARDA
jgi:putative transposase